MPFLKPKLKFPLKKPLSKKARVLLWGIIIIAVLAYNLSPIGSWAQWGSMIKAGGAIAGLYLTFSLIISLAIYLLGNALGVVLALITEAASIEIKVSEPFIQLGWTIIRDITNYFFIIVLMIIAFATILKIESYNYKKFLPRLVAMAILVNFSPYICQFFINLAQTVMMPFVNAFAPAGPGNIVNAFELQKIFTTDFSTAFGKVLGATSDAIAGVLPNTAGGFVGADGALSYFFVFLKLFIVTVALAITGFILSARVVLIWILAILSPIAFVFMVIPATQRYAQQWWSYFGKTLIIGPVIAFFFWLTLTLPQVGIAPDISNNKTTVGVVNPSNGAEAPLEKAIGGVLGGGTFCKSTEACNLGHILKTLFMVVFLLAGLIIAGQIGAHGGSMLGNFANKWMSRPGAFFGKMRGFGEKSGKGAMRVAAGGLGVKRALAQNRFTRFLLPSVVKEAWKHRQQELDRDVLDIAQGGVYDIFSKVYGRRTHEEKTARGRRVAALRAERRESDRGRTEDILNDTEKHTNISDDDEREFHLTADLKDLELYNTDLNEPGKRGFFFKGPRGLTVEEGAGLANEQVLYNWLLKQFNGDQQRAGRIMYSVGYVAAEKGDPHYQWQANPDEKTGKFKRAEDLHDQYAKQSLYYAKFNPREFIRTIRDQVFADEQIEFNDKEVALAKQKVTHKRDGQGNLIRLKSSEREEIEIGWDHETGGYYKLDREGNLDRTQKVDENLGEISLKTITSAQIKGGMEEFLLTQLNDSHVNSAEQAIRRGEIRPETLNRLKEKRSGILREEYYDSETNMVKYKNIGHYNDKSQLDSIKEIADKTTDQKQKQRILKFAEILEKGRGAMEEDGEETDEGPVGSPGTASSVAPLTLNPEAYERTKKLKEKAEEYGVEYTLMSEYAEKPEDYLAPGGMEAAERVLGRRDVEAREKEGKEPLKPAFSVNSLARALAEGQAPGPASMAMDFELLKDLEFMKGREGTQELTWESLSGEQGEQLVKKIESILLKKLNELKAKKEGTPAEAAKTESKREELQGAEAELAKLEKSLAEAVLPAEKSLRTEAVDKQKEKVGKLKNELTGLESGVVAPQELNAEETKQFESIETILGSNLLHNRDKLSALSIINTGGGREAIAHGRGHQIATQLDPAGEKQLAMWRGLSDEERKRRKEKIEGETGEKYDEMGLAKENFAIMYANETSVRDKSPEAIKFSGAQKKELVDLAEEKGITMGMAVGKGEINLADVQKEERMVDGKKTEVDVRGRMQEGWWKDLSDGEKTRRHKMIEKRVGHELTLDPKNKEHQNILARENAAMMYENEGPDGDKSPNAVRFNDAQRLELQRKAKENGVTLSIPVEITPEAAIGEIPSKWRAGLTHLKQGIQEKLRLRKKEAETTGQPPEELSLQEELEGRQTQYDQDIKERTKAGKVLEGEIEKKPDIIKQKVADHKKAKEERITAEEELATAQVEKKETAAKIQEHLGLAKKAESAGNRSAAKTHYDEARKLKKTHDEQTKVVEEKEKTVVEKKEKEKQASQAVTEEIRTTEQVKEKAEKNEKIVNLTKEMKDLEGLKLKYLSLSPEEIDKTISELPEDLRKMDLGQLEEKIKLLQQNLNLGLSLPSSIKGPMQNDLKDLQLFRDLSALKTMGSKRDELAKLKSEKAEEKEATKGAEAPAAKEPVERGAEGKPPVEAVGEMPEAPEDMADPGKREKYLGSLGAAIDRLNQAIRNSSLDDAGITTAVDSLKSKFDDLSNKMSKMPDEFGKLSGSLKQAVNDDPYGGSIFDRRAGSLTKEENIKLSYFMGQLLKIMKKDLEKDKGRPKGRE